MSPNAQPHNSITESWPSDMERTAARTSGSSRTAGARPGARRATSRWAVTGTTTAVSPPTPPTRLFKSIENYFWYHDSRNTYLLTLFYVFKDLQSCRGIRNCQGQVTLVQQCIEKTQGRSKKIHVAYKSNHWDRTMS